MKKVNKYHQFFTELLKAERLSSRGFSKKYNIKSFPSIYYVLKKDADKTVHPDTLRKIEEALSITINDDADPITYVRNEDQKQAEIKNIVTDRPTATVSGRDMVSNSKETEILKNYISLLEEENRRLKEILKHG